MSEDLDDNINFYGKISKFPRNSTAKNSYLFLEKLNISKKKLWYFIIEKDIFETENGFEELQLIKYNNKQGVNCKDFVDSLKEYYKKNDKMLKYVENLIVSGDKDFSIITNIPKVNIDDKKFITIITQDLIKLLK